MCQETNHEKDTRLFCMIRNTKQAYAYATKNKNSTLAELSTLAKIRGTLKLFWSSNVIP